MTATWVPFAGLRGKTALGLAAAVLAVELADAAIGDLDLSFDGDGIVATPIRAVPSTDYARAVLIDEEGRIVLAGSTWSPGAVDLALVRYSPDGTLDDGFGIRGKAIASLSASAAIGMAAALDSSGRIVVAGYASPEGATTRITVARFLPDGSLDSAFSGDGWATLDLGPGSRSSYGVGVVLDEAGRIVVVGHHIVILYARIIIARFLPDGEIDDSFGSNGINITEVRDHANTASDVAMDAAGRFVVAGTACYLSDCVVAVVRYRSDGGLDSTFDGDGKVTTRIGRGTSGGSAVAIDSAGRIVIAGTATYLGDQAVALARYEPDGRLDAQFGVGGTVVTSIPPHDLRALDLRIDAAGRIVVSGYSGDPGQEQDSVLLRYQPNGTLDTTFDDDGLIIVPGGPDLGYAVTLDSSGRILVAGSASYGSDGDDFVVTRHQVVSGLAPGDILLADARGLTGSGGVLALNPATGACSIVAEGLWASGPSDVAVDRSGRVFFVDAVSGTVVEVDPSSGRQTLLSYGEDLVSAVGLAADGASSIVVANAGGQVIRVDSTTGERTHVSSGGLLASPQDVAVAADGAIFVVDGVTAGGAIVRVDAIDGSQTLVASGDALVSPRGIAIDGQGDALVTSAGLADGAGAILRVDLMTGAQTVIGLPLFAHVPGHLTVDPGGRLVVAYLGTAEQPGGILRWSFDPGQVEAWSAPSLVSSSGVAVFGTSVCGDGVQGDGESCDRGTGIDDDCCSDDCRVEAMGTVCRAAADSCDAADVCDGVTAACPPDAALPDGDLDAICDALDLCPVDPDPEQADRDGDGMGDACDPCTLGVEIARPYVRISGYSATLADGRALLRGTLMFPSSPELDPVASGLRVRIEDQSDRIVIDETIPGEAYSPTTRTGWRSVGRDRFRFIGGADSAVRDVRLWKQGPRGMIDFVVRVRQPGLAAIQPALPLTAMIILKLPRAATGQCGEVEFADSGLRGCRWSRGGNTAICR